MSKSEISLLRRELARVVTEFEKVKKTMYKTNAELTKKVTLLEIENDRLTLENAGYRRRLRKYENPNMSSSTDSLYNSDRTAFRKRMDMEAKMESDGSGPKEGEKSESEGGPESEGEGAGDKTRKGPPAGHAGASHKNKAERTESLPVCRCEKCGRGHLVRMPSIVKMVYDFPDDGAMRIERVAYLVGQGLCKRCNHVSSAVPPTIPGTSLGPKALGFVEEYYDKRSTDYTVSYYFKALYGFGISPNAIWNARKALKKILKGAYEGILAHIAEAAFVQFDESHMKMNGKKGYVWLVTTGDATYLVAAPSRAALVINAHFARLLGKPVVVDGYTVYNMFPVKQRCWVHLLRAAEEYAIKNGGNDLACYRRLLALYRSVKDRESAGSGECLDLERTVLQIASDYGESHDFRTTLENAAPCMFTFLRHPGMPPHNNAAELEIRDTAVLHRNVRHQLSEPEGREVFSVLISVARTCHKQGIFPRQAVENIIMDPDWSIFKPPEQYQKVSVPAVAA